MKVTCPGCDAVVPAGQLNVATDLGVCSACDETFTISEVVDAGGGAAAFDVKNAPAGSWFRSTVNGWEVGASTRSPVAFFLVPFMCVWSGGALGGIYGTQIAAGEFNLGMSLFGIPFLLGSLLFWSFALMAVCGKVVVSVDRNRGRVFTGVGRIGWTRQFDWASITSVTEINTNVRSPGGYGMVIALSGASRLSLGSNLNEKRRYFVLQTLRKMLAGKQSRG
jgi:hypothetical protein